MPAFIHITHATLDKLKEIMKKKDLPTHEALLEYFIKKEQDGPDDLFGYMKGKLISFSQDDEGRDHVL